MTRAMEDEMSDPFEAACRKIRCSGYDSWLDLRSDMRAAIAAYLRARAEQYRREAPAQSRREVQEAMLDSARHTENLAAEVERQPAGKEER